jgi:hypothetical protein
VDVIGEKPYTGQQSMLDAMEPKRVHRYWKTEFLPGLSGGFLDAFREGAVKVSHPSRSPSSSTSAGPSTNGKTTMGRSATATPGTSWVRGHVAAGTPAEHHVAWVRDGWEQIRPFSTGGNYVNFQLAEDDAARTADAYRSNYRRLRNVMGSDQGPVIASRP